jgi:DNA ligase-4
VGLFHSCFFFSPSESQNRPDFIILFSISYGLSRKQLEEWNFYLQSGMSPKFVSWRRRNESVRPHFHVPSLPLVQKVDLIWLIFQLGHTLQLANGVKPPMVVLKQPLLGEIFGAGFQKLRDETLYELRWPRLSKIYPERRQDGGKSWTEGQLPALFASFPLLKAALTIPLVSC